MGLYYQLLCDVTDRDHTLPYACHPYCAWMDGWVGSRMTIFLRAHGIILLVGVLKGGVSRQSSFIRWKWLQIQNVSFSSNSSVVSTQAASAAAAAAVEKREWQNHSGLDCVCFLLFPGVDAISVVPIRHTPR
jgi:hypothetical protein